MGCGGGRRRPGLPPAPSAGVLARTHPQPRAPAPAPAPHSYHPPRSLLYCPPPVASPPRSDNVTHPQFEPTGFLRKLGGHPCHDPTKVMPTTGALAGHGSRSAAAAAAGASRACFQGGMPAARTPPPPALTCWSHFITVLHPKQDLVVPSMKTPEDWRASPLAGAPTRNRTWLAFHRGRVRGGLGYPPAPACRLRRLPGCPCRLRLLLFSAGPGLAALGILRWPGAGAGAGPGALARLHSAPPHLCSVLRCAGAGA